MPSEFTKPDGWDARPSAAHSRPLEDRVRDELAARRSRRVGQCPACGSSVGHDEDYTQVHGFVFHINCVAPEAAASDA
jgi:hypothetical protein